MSGIDPNRRNKTPRMVSDLERERLEEFLESISYSARYVKGKKSFLLGRNICSFGPHTRRYSDSEFEYRHVQLPKPMLKAIPKDYFDPSNNTLKLLWEDEWRGLGITQVSGSL